MSTLPLCADERDEGAIGGGGTLGPTDDCPLVAIITTMDKEYFELSFAESKKHWVHKNNHSTRSKICVRQRVQTSTECLSQIIPVMSSKSASRLITPLVKPSAYMSRVSVHTMF